MTTALLTEFKVLGVCGGIGSGKSTAAKLLVSDCACLTHLDADSLAHSVYSPGSQAVQDIAAEFGSGVLVEEGTLEIDRKKLGAIVFADRNDMAVSSSRRCCRRWPVVVALHRRSFEGGHSIWISPLETFPETRTTGLATRQEHIDRHDCPGEIRMGANATNK